MNKPNQQKLIKNFLQSFFTNPDFKFVQKLAKKFKEAEIYLVGGKVRDILLQRESHDYDFVVRNVTANDLEKWLSKQGKVDLVGKSFGVLNSNLKNIH